MIQVALIFKKIPIHINSFSHIFVGNYLQKIIYMYVCVFMHANI